MFLYKIDTYLILMFKVVLLGDTCTGKSLWLSEITHHKNTLCPTLVTEIHSKVYKDMFTVSFWDIGLTDDTETCCKHANAAIIFGDNDEPYINILHNASPNAEVIHCSDQVEDDLIAFLNSSTDPK